MTDPDAVPRQSTPPRSMRCATTCASFSCRRSSTVAGRSSYSKDRGCGKKFALRQLASAFDPCHVSVHPIEYDRRQAAEGHWLARFWRALREPATRRSFSELVSARAR